MVDEEKRARARESEIEQNVQILLTKAVLLKCGVLFCEWKHTTIWKYGKSFNYNKASIKNSITAMTLQISMIIIMNKHRLNLYKKNSQS